MISARVANTGEEARSARNTAEKRVILSMGGKGGVGETSLMPELRRASLVMRAQSYRRRMFAEFESVKELLLP